MITSPYAPRIWSVEVERLAPATHAHEELAVALVMGVVAALEHELPYAHVDEPSDYLLQRLAPGAFGLRALKGEGGDDGRLLRNG